MTGLTMVLLTPFSRMVSTFLVVWETGAILGTGYGI